MKNKTRNNFSVCNVWNFDKQTIKKKSYLGNVRLFCLIRLVFEKSVWIGLIFKIDSGNTVWPQIETLIVITFVLSNQTFYDDFQTLCTLFFLSKKQISFLHIFSKNWRFIFLTAFPRFLAWITYRILHVSEVISVIYVVSVIRGLF